MLCYGGTPQQLRKDREDMFCAASTRLGLDLCLMDDSTGLFSFLGEPVLPQPAAPHRRHRSREKKKKRGVGSKRNGMIFAFL